MTRLLDGTDILAAHDSTGDTLLHIAARCGHVDLVEEIVARGAPGCLEARNAEGKRAFDVADASTHILLSHFHQDSTAIVRDPDLIVDVEVEHPVARADVPRLCSLPSEICEAVLCEAASDGPAPIMRLRETCSRLKTVADSENVWERLCWHHFKLLRVRLLSECAHGLLRTMHQRLRSAPYPAADIFPFGLMERSLHAAPSAPGWHQGVTTARTRRALLGAA